MHQSPRLGGGTATWQACSLASGIAVPDI
jgi:hypothetical protein